MQPFRYHVFACDQQKPEGIPCCSARGSAAVIDTLRRELRAQGLDAEVQLTVCGSVGLCEHGPNLIVYPQGVWYSGVAPSDVPEIVDSHFRNHQPVARLVREDEAAVRAEVIANRDRYLASLRAKEASGALPDELAERIRGFQESRIILSALELDVFSLVNGGATAGEVAARAATDPRATDTLLNALVAMRLVVKDDGRFRPTPISERHLTGESRLALLHMSSLWNSWSTLTDCVRHGTATGFEEMADRDDTWTEPFIAAMHRNAVERAPVLVEAVGTPGKRMLDIGGGSGAYSIAFAQAHPELRVDLLDLGTVTEIARRHIRAAGLEDRITLRTGDLTRDDFGSGYDLVLLSAICHMLSPGENRDLLSRVRRALNPGGRVVISDFVLEPDKTAPKFAALFSINMLAVTRGGANYNEAEYREWLEATGFNEIRRVRLPGTAHLVIGSARAE